MLCVFIDAWNPEYLRHMPFLKSLTKSNLNGFLEVPLGYTGIIASFVTGVMPKKHGIFDLFVPDNNPRQRIKNPYMLAAIRLLQNKRIFYTPLQVKEASYFKPSINKTWPQKNCLPYPTIFDILEQSNKSFEVIDWPNHFKNRKGGIIFSKSCETVLKMTKKSKADFIFAHFLDLEIAHKYGIKSKETIEAAKNIDDAAKQLYEKDKNILFFSDHGMNDIKKEVDIDSEIKKTLSLRGFSGCSEISQISDIKNLGLRFGKDFVYIVGSTTVEFWFKNSEAKRRVIGLLKVLRYGQIIDKEKFGIATDSLIFLADFETGFYPNFFSKKRFRAMHGWNPKEQKTFYILKSENRKAKGRKDAKMVDFMPTILNIMGLQASKAEKSRFDGKSLS